MHVTSHMSSVFITLPPCKVDCPQSMSYVSLPFGQLILTSLGVVSDSGIGLNVNPCMSIHQGALGCFSWNSALLSGKMLSLGSQVQLVWLGYPSHLTKYLSFPWDNLESIISSMMYSLPSLVMIGGGGYGCL
jgi:hypothetical protein